MLAVFLGLPSLMPESAPPHGRSALTIQASGRSALNGNLSGYIDKMNASGHGIFNEDVSAIVAPYFPPGISVAAAEERARLQDLKPFKPYRGHKTSGSGTMYVTTFDMMKATVSSVFVAIYLTFESDTTGQPVLKSTAAYLRASDM